MALIGWFKSDLPGSKTHPPNPLKTRLLLLEPITAFIGRSGRGHTLEKSLLFTLTHTHNCGPFRVPSSEFPVQSSQFTPHAETRSRGFAPLRRLPAAPGVKKEKQLKKKRDSEKPSPKTSACRRKRCTVLTPGLMVALWLRSLKALLQTSITGRLISNDASASSEPRSLGSPSPS